MQNKMAGLLWIAGPHSNTGTNLHVKKYFPEPHQELGGTYRIRYNGPLRSESKVGDVKCSIPNAETAHPKTAPSRALEQSAVDVLYDISQRVFAGLSRL